MMDVLSESGLVEPLNNHMATNTMPPSLLSSMREGVLVLTPNHRLSRQLLTDYYQQKEIPQEKPATYAYQTFLNQLFLRAQHQNPHDSYPQILTPIQQRRLWRKILDHKGSSNELIDTVEQAWTRCHHGNVDLDDPRFSHTVSTQTFQAWCDAFQQELSARHAITADQLAHYLLDNTPEVFSHHAIIWACFDDYTPQQHAIRAQLQHSGCQLIDYDRLPQNTNAYLFAATDHNDEITQILAWLNRRLSMGDQRIAVVVPDLQARAASLFRQLKQHLPEDRFNLSLGHSLAQYPLIMHALEWLTLNQEYLTHHQLRLLLHSPFLAGSKTEQEKRYAALQSLSCLLESSTPFASALRALSTDVPDLARRLQQLNVYPEKASPAEWVEHFITRLKGLGFPGDLPLQSEAYQCYSRWLQLLDEFIQLAFIEPCMTRQQAENSLYELVQSTIFHKRTPTSPIQILGLLEAAGCTFDAIWVCGMSDQCLPQKTSFSPLIPIEIQREAQMPYSSAERELAISVRLIERLRNSCQDIIFSYPQWSGDQPQLPCSLIKALIPYPCPPSTPQVSTVKLIPVEENYHLPHQSNNTVTGGTSVLAHQATCPFQAFAAHRLHAKDAPLLGFGPNAMERGQLIHRVLEYLWQILQSQDQLIRYSETDLETLIQDVITRAMAPLIEQRQYSFSPLVQEVERSRLRSLVYASLDFEKQRAPFVIDALEKPCAWSIAGVTLNVRIDRIDRMLHAPWRCIIDYKTNLGATKPWNEDPLEHPQLPLYACLEDDIEAVLFLALKTGKIECQGLSAHADHIPDITTLKDHETWSDYQDKWHQQLTDLAQAFREGHCAPMPTRDSHCTRCEFQSLCRKPIRGTT